MNTKYYEESGKVNYNYLLVGSIFLLILALTLAYVYAGLIYIIPIIYFNVLITFGFGLGIGLGLNLCFRFIKCRNKKWRSILSLVVIGMAFYFHWVAFIDTVILQGFPSPEEYVQTLGMILNPFGFFELVYEINKIGTWSIGINGLQINGILLSIVWFLEALIIFVCVFLVIKNYDVLPYSESFNMLYPRYTIQKEFESIPLKQIIEPNLNANVIETLRGLKEGSGMRHSKIYLYYLEKESKQYLSIDKIHISKNGGGKVEKKNIIRNYQIDNSTAEQLFKDFKILKDSFTQVFV